jgi:hypothetical protein
LEKNKIKLEHVFRACTIGKQKNVGPPCLSYAPYIECQLKKGHAKF